MVQCLVVLVLYGAVSVSIPLSISDEETDMDVHDRGMLYYRLLKLDVKEVPTECRHSRVSVM